METPSDMEASEALEIARNAYAGRRQNRTIRERPAGDEARHERYRDNRSAMAATRPSQAKCAFVDRETIAIVTR